MDWHIWTASTTATMPLISHKLKTCNIAIRLLCTRCIDCRYVLLLFCNRTCPSQNGIVGHFTVTYFFVLIFSPLQTCIIQHTLGEYFWENHKAKLIDHRTETLMEQEKALKLRRKMEVKSKELVNEEMLKQRMGYKYYLFPWKRGQEKARMMRIAVLEQELDKTYSTKLIRTELKV